MLFNRYQCDSSESSEDDDLFAEQEDNSFMSNYRRKEEITASDFLAIWNKYDEDGTGYLEGAEIELFFRELVSTSSDKECIRAYMDAYDTDGDGKISMLEHEQDLTSIEFMRVWRMHDLDRSGYIETDELKGFLKELFHSNKKLVDEDKLEEYTSAIIKLFDKNHDGKLELKEMALLLPVKENFLLQYQNKPNLTLDEFKRVFAHYDADGDGIINGDELYGFLKDLVEHEKQDFDAKELEEYKRLYLEYVM